MAQLSSYTIHDFYLVSICSSIFSSYLAEEVEAGIESVSAYLYSAS